LTVASENSISLGDFALTPVLLYHTSHTQNHLTRSFLGVDVAPSACLGKPRGASSTQQFKTKYKEVLARGANPQKKHLIPRLVKKGGQVAAIHSF
jgi:hypothetical protein